MESYVEGIPKLTIKNDENMRAAQDKTSGFSNKVLESSMIPDAVKTRVDDPKFLMQAGFTRCRTGRYSD